jgi:hypothetical protein
VIEGFDSSYIHNVCTFDVANNAYEGFSAWILS